MRTSNTDIACMSLRDLRTMLPSTEGVKSPSENWFRENVDEIILFDSCEEGDTAVYSNGFYTFTADRGEHLAVLRVDGFQNIRYVFADRTISIVDESDYLDSLYLVALFANAKEQWDKNAYKRNAYRHGYYLNNDSTDWGDEARAVSAEEEVLRKEEKCEVNKMASIALSVLTERQRENVEMHVMAGNTQTETANVIGISRGSVQKHLDRAMKKMKKLF